VILVIGLWFAGGFWKCYGNRSGGGDKEISLTHGVASSLLLDRFGHRPNATGADGERLIEVTGETRSDPPPVAR